MGMNMAGEHCPNCGDELDDGQIGLCEDCGGDRLGTHGSPELDADARKLEAMGLSAGATMADVDPVQVALAACIGIIEILSTAVAQNQEAWEGEEDSVQEEHAELMERNRKTIAAYQRFAGVLASIAGGAHGNGE